MSTTGSSNLLVPAIELVLLLAIVATAVLLVRRMRS